MGVGAQNLGSSCGEKEDKFTFDVTHSMIISYMVLL